MSKKTNPIPAAKKLLEASGYTVIKKRPDPKIGDVVRMHNDDGTFDDVLITFHQTDARSDGDVFPFGGVVASAGRWEEQNTEAMWIDNNEWAKDDGQYEVIGHIDLTKYTNVIPATVTPK